MPVVTEIKGLQRLVAQLQSMAAKVTTDWNVSVIVGYQTNYALHVHERMDIFHPVGQAKFLEQPARELDRTGVLGDMVSKGLLAGLTPAQCLIAAGLRIQRESQKLVPVDTGLLKNSAFTQLETKRTA